MLLCLSMSTPTHFMHGRTAGCLVIKRVVPALWSIGTWPWLIGIDVTGMILEIHGIRSFHWNYISFWKITWAFVDTVIRNIHLIQVGRLTFQSISAFPQNRFIQRDSKRTSYSQRKQKQTMSSCSENCMSLSCPRKNPPIPMMKTKKNSCWYIFYRLWSNNIEAWNTYCSS